MSSRVFLRICLVAVSAVVVAQLGWGGATLAQTTAPPAEVPASLLHLASRAKNAFSLRMNPEMVRRNVLTSTKREAGSTEREYVRRSYDAAIDALVRQATSAKATTKVESALRQIVVKGQSTEADSIFGEVAANSSVPARVAAAAWRHGVALTELPVALAERINPTGFGLPGWATSQLAGTTGQRALPAYRRAAELDPDEPWTWLVLSWLGVPANGTLEQGLRAAEKAKDAAASIALLQLASRHFQQGGQASQAEQLEQLAVATAKTAAAHASSGVGVRDYALALDSLGSLLVRQGQTTSARSAFESSLSLREIRAAADPGDVEAQFDLVASHMQLARFEAQNDHLDKAGDIYRQLARRDRFTPFYDRASWGGIALGAVLMAGIFTLVSGIALLMLYRLRIAGWMGLASSSQSAQPSSATQQASMMKLNFRNTAPSQVTKLRVSADTSNRLVNRASSRAALVQLVAGAAFSAVATVLYLRLGGLEFLPARTAVLFWNYAWPSVFVLGFLWSGDRKRQMQVVLSYFAGLAMLCLWVGAKGTPGMDIYGVPVPGAFQPLIFWGIASLQTIYLAFFLNRRVRSIGPALLVMALVLSLGGALAGIAQSTFAGIEFRLWLSTRFHLPMTGIVMLAAVYVAGALVAMPLAVLALTGLRFAYIRKWINEQTLVFDAIWLLQSVSLSSALIHEIGFDGWVGLSTFVVYKMVTLLGSRPIVNAARARAPLRLLLLRVFGYQRRSERFFDALASRWRYAGSIQMIAAPDLAASTIDPNEFMDFLSGRLRRQFIIEPGDLPRRMARLDQGCDVDGRFRVNEMFCGNDAWKSAVQALMRESDLVLMDLRGFSEQNKGCLFELQTMLDCVPIDRMVLLVDASTDGVLLRSSLVAFSQHLNPGSPNAGISGAIHLSEVGKSNVAAVSSLLALVD